MQIRFGLIIGSIIFVLSNVSAKSQIENYEGFSSINAISLSTDLAVGNEVLMISEGSQIAALNKNTGERILEQELASEDGFFESVILEPTNTPVLADILYDSFENRFWVLAIQNSKDLLIAASSQEDGAPLTWQFNRWRLNAESGSYPEVLQFQAEAMQSGIHLAYSSRSGSAAKDNTFLAERATLLNPLVNVIVAGFAGGGTYYNAFPNPLDRLVQIPRRYAEDTSDPNQSLSPLSLTWLKRTNSSWPNAELGFADRVSEEVPYAIGKLNLEDNLHLFSPDIASVNELNQVGNIKIIRSSINYQKPVFRNEKIWFTNSLKSFESGESHRSLVHWYSNRIIRNSTLQSEYFQSGQIELNDESPDSPLFGGWAFQSAMVVDREDNMALAFLVSSESLALSIALSVRDASEPLNQTRPIEIIKLSGFSGTPNELDLGSITLEPDPRRTRSFFLHAPYREGNGSIRSIVSKIQIPIIGDINNDCIVNTADLGILLGALRSQDLDADLNFDGSINTADLGLLLSQFNHGCGTEASLSASSGASIIIDERQESSLLEYNNVCWSDLIEYYENCRQANLRCLAGDSTSDENCNELHLWCQEFGDYFYQLCRGRNPRHPFSRN